MPILELTDGNGNGLVIGPLKVLATMLHPESEDRRKMWMASVMLEVAAQRKVEPPNTPMEILDMIHRSSGPRSIKRTAVLNFNCGRLAGEVLLSVLSSAEYEPRHATVRKALALVGRHIVRNWPAGSPASPSSLKAIWKKFKPVAHLWAAARYELEMHRREASELLEYWMLPDRFLRFLAVAEKLRVMGENHRPLGGRNNSSVLDRHVLNPDVTWKFPSDLELPEVTVRMPRPTPWMQNVRQDYNVE
jgi:hypothetical protein